jgi:hypothetical protein
MNVIKSILISFIFVLVTIPSFAQKKKGGVALQGGAGISMFGILGSLSFAVKDDFSVESNSTTAWVGALDYAFEEKFSIGLSGGYQEVAQTIKDYQYVDLNGNNAIGQFSYRLSRLNVGARVLFHFGEGRMDAYVGFKPGVNIYNIEMDSKNNSEIPNPSWLRLSGSTFAFQVIPLGLRAYLTDNIGLFMESGIGAPSFISGGICFGFQLPTPSITTTN